MNILLISKTQIVIQIFDLICKKLDYSFSVMNNNDVKNRYDMIILDTEFIDDRFNIIKQLTNSIGAISNEELSSYNSEYFSINRPFLPTELLEILKEQEQIIKNNKEKESSYPSDEEYFDDTTEEVAAFVDSLADDIAYENEEEDDESIVTLESLYDGGVLDSLELNKISDMLHQNQINPTSYPNSIELEETDFRELSEIIDDALDEVKGYEFSLNSEPIHLVLNNYNIDELKPLLKKFDQQVIDKLSSGETIDLKLSLKATN